jgi:DNA-directed RNA polymerase specialized sigma24 family protein
MRPRVQPWSRPHAKSRPLTDVESAVAANLFRYARAVLLDLGVTDEDDRHDMAVDIAIASARNYKSGKGFKSAYSFVAWLCRTKLMHRPARLVRSKNGRLRTLLQSIPFELAASDESNLVDVQDEYQRLVASLPLRTRVIFRLTGEGYTNSEQGAIFGMHRESIRQIKERAFAEIETYMNGSRN